MKKPNITEGEWFQAAEYVETKYGSLIARCYRYVESREDLANAKAISAVPEMIDALIEVYTFVDGEYLSSAGYKKVRKALKKAGVDFSVQMQGDKT